MSEPDVNSMQKSVTTAGPSGGAADVICYWLIRRAAHRAPGPLAERLEEEWRADLLARRSALSRLRLALGCCWATWVIALELRPLRTQSASLTATGSVVTGLWGGGSRLFADRSTAFVVVVFIHVALFYALMSGLTLQLVKSIPAPLQPTFLPASRQRATLPPMAIPPIDQRRLVIQPPEVPNAGIPADPLTDVATTLDVSLTAPSAPPHEVKRVSGGPGIGFPNADDHYPEMARRLQEHGISAVHVCVNTAGQLTAAPTIAQSSGSARLDDGAILLAKAGSGHYRPNTEDGRPVPSCYSFRVRFELRN
jgi:TonB family protein